MNVSYNVSPCRTKFLIFAKTKPKRFDKEPASDDMPARMQPRERKGRCRRGARLKGSCFVLCSTVRRIFRVSFIRRTSHRSKLRVFLADHSWCPSLSYGWSDSWRRWIDAMYEFVKGAMLSLILRGTFPLRFWKVGRSHSWSFTEVYFVMIWSRYVFRIILTFIRNLLYRVKKVFETLANRRVSVRYWFMLSRRAIA